MRHFITVRTEGIVLFVLFALITSSSFAQLSGIKTIPGNYATITAAVNALNAQGVGAGGVTFNVAAGYTETLTARINLTATGTASNPIVFQKSGSGANPKITAFAGIASGSSATPDGIWSLKGSDYVTINGIDLFDPNTSSATTMMEYGFGLFRNTAYDGAQNNTIKNCTVTMNYTNNSAGTSPMPDGSTCILVINSTPTAATTAFAPFDSTGTNSYNKFYSNLLQNCNYGIYMTGSLAVVPYDLGDHGNDIGGTSLSTGNTILNFGGAYFSSITAAVRCLYQWESNISYNTINSNNGSGGFASGDIYGIRSEYGRSSNCTFNNNTITVTASHGVSDYGIYLTNSGTPLSNTININNNSFPNCSSLIHFYGIYCKVDATNVNICSNTISGYTTPNWTMVDHGDIYCIYVLGTTSDPVNLSVNYNTVDSVTRTVSIGSYLDEYLYGIFAKGQNCSCSYNTINNIVMIGSVPYLHVTGISVVNANSGSGTYQNNIIKDVLISPGSESYFTGLTTGGSNILQLNEVYIDTLYGKRCYFYGIVGGGQILNNKIHTVQINPQATYSGTIYGISAGNNSAGSNTPLLITNNQVYELSQTGGSSGTLSGISVGGVDLSCSVSRNNIFNLSCTNNGTTVYGLYLTNNTGATKTIFNNTISDLRASNSTSTGAIAGIKTGDQGTFNIYYNTVFLNANSTGATFGTAALYASAASTLDLRDNILVNTSIPNGGGATVAYLRSSTTLTSYSALSNNNLFYAGPPGLYRLIYFDGTNKDQTLSAYKTRVAPRDAASVTENPPFANSTTTPYNLHISPTTPTQCESGGMRITSPGAITDDIDGDIRWGETGYSGTGFSTDIGADEFAGTPVYTCTGPNPGNTLTTANSICYGQSVVLSLQNVQTGTGVSYQWQKSANGSSYTDISGATGATLSVTPTAPTWYLCKVVCLSGPATAYSTPLFITLANYISAVTPDSRCGSGSVQLAASGTGTIKWYSAATGGSLLGTGSPWTTPSISSTTTYYTCAETALCTGPRIAVTATINPIPSAVTITPSTAAIGSILQLVASGGLVNAQGTDITWSPLTSLYTNPGGTIPYAGQASTTVYANPAAPITYTATATSTAGCTSSGTCIFSALKTLNLSFLLEGLYSGSGTMTQAYDANGPHFGAGIADKIAIELHDGANYSTLIQSFSNIDLHTAGTATITVPAVYGGSYYITIKHRNSVATVSSAPVSFAGSVISYSFTDAQNKAFGNNLKPTTDGRFTFYGGDVNQDDLLDGSDMATVDNLTAAYASGYLPEDVNGDGIIDGSDMAVIDNNTALYVAAVYP